LFEPRIVYGFFTQEEYALRELIGDQLVKDEKLLKSAKRYKECCSKFLHYGCKDYSTYDGFKHEVSVPMRCESRLCPRCARIRGFVIKERLLKAILPINKGKTKKPMLLTLTLRNYGKLEKDRIRLLSKSMRKLINHFYPKSKGYGAIAVIEVGKNNNLHVHALVYGPYIPHSSLSQKWLKLTGDSMIVDIRMVHNPKMAIGYILKYMTKIPVFSEPYKYLEYAKAFKGVRRLHTYGIFYNNIPVIKKIFECPICGKKYIGIKHTRPPASCEFYYRQFENYQFLKKSLQSMEVN
jgi:hypothetical protein